MNRKAALALLGAASIPRPAAAQPALPLVRLASPPVDSATSAIYGIRSGLFRRAGLDVQFIPMSNGGAGAAAVAGGSAEIGYQNVLSTASAHLHNVPFPIVSPGQVFTVKAPDPVLIVAKDSPIRTARDLNGNIVATSTLHDFGSVGLQAWIDKNGGDSSTIKLIEIPYSAMAAAIDAQRVDAATMLSPASTQALATGRFRVLAAFYEAIAPSFMTAAWYATDGWMTAQRDVALRFSRVMRDAAIFANAHPEVTAPMAAQVAGVDVETMQHGTRAVFAEKLDLAQFQSVIDFLAKYKALDRSFDVHEIVSPAIANIWR